MTIEKHPRLWIHLLFGVAIGLGSALLSHFHVKTVFYYAWFQLFGIFFLLSVYHAKQSLKPILTSIIGAGIASFPIYFWQSPQGHEYTTATMLIALLSAYAINALHIAYYANQRWLNYEGLFFAVWDTFVDLLIAGVFTLAVWMLIFLCQALMTVLTININPLIDSPWFTYITTCTGFSIGLYIALSAKKIVRNIRQIILLLCKYLFIVTAIISLIFFIAWIVTLRPLANVNTSIQSVFLSIAFLSIIFANGVYQQGDSDSPYPAALKWLVTIFIITTPVYSILSLYFYISSNVAHHAPTLSTLVNYSLLILYNLSYAIVALRFQKSWMKGIEKTNIVLAFVVICIALLTNNHWFNGLSFFVDLK